MRETEATDVWESRARLELSARSVPKDLADTVLAEVAQHCRESGESPEEGFGSPEGFAHTVARERVPAPDDDRADGYASEVTPLDPDERSETEHEEEGSARRGYFAAVLVQLGVMSLVMGLYLTIAGGGQVGITTTTLSGCAAVVVAVAALHGASHARRAASRTGVALCGLLAAGGVCTAAFLWTQVSGSVIVHVPTIALTSPGVLLIVAMLFNGSPSRRTREKLTTEEWLRRLPKLLEGHHGIKRARAAELAREADRHLEESGTDAEREFGSVTVYAQQLAKAENPRRPWWRRADLRAGASTILFSLYTVHNVHSGGAVWLTVVAAVGAVAATTSLAEQLRRRGSP